MSGKQTKCFRTYKRCFKTDKIKSPFSGAFIISLIVYADLFASAVLSLKADLTIDLGEQSIILADTNIVAGMEFGTTLANQNAACAYGLTVTAFEAQALRRGIATVFGTTACLFVCHTTRLLLFKN